MGRNSGKYVLIYRLGGIGDAVVALPAIRLIRKNYPDCRLVLFNLSVADNLAQAELYGEPGLFAEKHFALPPHNLRQKLALYGKFLRVGFRHRYAALYCFAPARPRVLDWLFRILHRARARLCLLPERDNRLPIHEEYLEFLRREGMRPDGDCLAFPVSGENREKAAALLRKAAPGREAPLVAFGIGGAEQVCRWPLDKYSELLAKLRREFAFIPVYLGGENDRENARKLMNGHGGFFLYDTPCRDAAATIAFLGGCRCYIGNDTGSAHLAAAAGIPCAVIYSAHNLPAEKWHPFGRDNLYFRGDAECAGCEKRVCPRGDPAPCLTLVAVDTVFAQVRDAWLAGRMPAPFQSPGGRTVP